MSLSHSKSLKLQTLATCGMDYLVRLCKKEVQRPNKLDEVAPLVKALYVVAFHSDDCVWLLGFFEKGPAQVMYDVLSDKLAKVLINREKSEVSFQVFPRKVC